MARLILLNGPPSAGKSTLAKLYAADHPLALVLDIDRIRAQLGGWREQPGPAGLRARAVALAAAATHLQAGHDVVVPQLVARIEFIERLEATAVAAGAEFREVMLMDTKENLQARYRERARLQATAARPDAAVCTDQTDLELARTYESLQPVIGARPATLVIVTQAGRVELTYRDLLAGLGGHGSHGRSKRHRNG